MREAEALGRPIPELPHPSPSRPHVYLELSINRRGAGGRIVIELFDDVNSSAAQHFQARCTAAARDSFAGTLVHKILSGVTLFGGISPHFTESVSVKRDASLRHVSPGAVSVSVDGSEFCISLVKALQLDDTHQVVGRVVKGIEVVEAVAEVATRADDRPCQRVAVARCGLTDAAGTADIDGAGGGAGGGGGLAIGETLEREEDETKNAVAAALEAAAGKKRRKNGGDGDAGVQLGKRKLKRKNAFDAVLLGSSSDDSDSGGSSGDDD